jgi:hypothetical protein
LGNFSTFLGFIAKNGANCFPGSVLSDLAEICLVVRFRLRKLAIGINLVLLGFGDRLFSSKCPGNRRILLEVFCF